jgi:hypothetical protein
MTQFEKDLINAIHKELEIIYQYHRHSHNNTLPIVLFVDDIIKIYYNDNRAAIYLQDDSLKIDYYFPRFQNQLSGGHLTNTIDLNDPNFNLPEIAKTINTNLLTEPTLDKNIYKSARNTAGMVE